MDYIIRAAEERDLPAIIELCRKHAEFESAVYDSNGKQHRLQEAIFSIAPKLFCFVIESDGKLAGYYTYTFDFSTWDAKSFLHLDCLYLEPRFRGMRIGEKVFAHLREVARKNDCANIQWQTPTFNHRAIKFYNRIGGKNKDKVRFTLDV